MADGSSPTTAGADSILDETALLRVVQPFVEDPERVIASGGVVAVANGASVYRGRIENVRHARRRIARIQSVEYARSFLLGLASFGGSRLSTTTSTRTFTRDSKSCA